MLFRLKIGDMVVVVVVYKSLIFIKVFYKNKLKTVYKKLIF